MKHTVTIIHEVEAATWDLAVEAVLRQPALHVRKVTVKSPGKALTHVAPSVFQHAAQQVADESK